jgi:hypothetical protein
MWEPRRLTTLWAFTSCYQRFGGTYRLHLQGFLLVLFFDLEDGGDMFFRNVAWLSMDYMTLYPRRWYSSWPLLRTSNPTRQTQFLSQNNKREPRIRTGHLIFGPGGHHYILMGNVCMSYGSMVYPHSKHCVAKFKNLNNPFSPAAISIYMPCTESKHYISNVLTICIYKPWSSGSFPLTRIGLDCLYKETQMSTWLWIILYSLF